MNLTSRHKTLLLVATAALFAVAAVSTAWQGPPTSEFWFWMVACLAGEALWLRLPLGNATLSMASCFNLAALLVLPIGEAMAVTAIATLAVDVSVMKKPWIRGIYNASHTALAVGAGALVFGWVAGGNHDLVALVTNVNLLPFVFTGLAYYVVNRAAVTAAVALHEDLRMLPAWRRNFGNGYELLSTGAVFSLGILLAVHYAGIGMGGTLLVILPLVLACDGYQRFTKRTPAKPADIVMAGVDEKEKAA